MFPSLFQSQMTCKMRKYITACADGTHEHCHILLMGSGQHMYGEKHCTTVIVEYLIAVKYYSEVKLCVGSTYMYI